MAPAAARSPSTNATRSAGTGIGMPASLIARTPSPLPTPSPVAPATPYSTGIAYHFRHAFVSHRLGLAREPRVRPLDDHQRLRDRPRRRRAVSGNVDRRCGGGSVPPGDRGLRRTEEDPHLPHAHPELRRVLRRPH